MRFLVDANLSPRVASGLISAGFDSVHVTEVGLLTASDRAILDYAAENGLVIVSADTDFGELLAFSRGRSVHRQCCSARRIASLQISRLPCWQRIYRQRPTSLRQARW